MTRRGFGKSFHDLPIRVKGKKAAKNKLKTYTLCHVGADGVLRSLQVKANSRIEALRKFDTFLNILNLYHSGASDEQVLAFVRQNPIDDGGEA